MLSDSKHLSNVSEKPTAGSFFQVSQQSSLPKRPSKEVLARPTATALSPEVSTASFSLPELPNAMRSLMSMI